MNSKTYRNYDILRKKMIYKYLKVDFKDDIQVATLVSDLCLLRNELDEATHRTFSSLLQCKGFKTEKECKVNFTAYNKYNNLEQFFMLDDDKNQILNFLVSRYIYSVEHFGKPSEYVFYLSRLYCDRFRDFKDLDKFTLIKNSKSFKQFVK